MKYVNFIGNYTSSTLSQLFSHVLKIDVLQDEVGCYTVIEDQMLQSLKLLCLEENIKILISHQRDRLCFEALKHCHYQSNEVYHISDIVFQELKKENTTIQQYLNDIFDRLQSHLKYTIQAYMMNNMNVLQTAKEIYVHRNTLNYRLQQIEDITGVDVRDYQNLLLFYFYNKN